MSQGGNMSFKMDSNPRKIRKPPVFFSMLLYLEFVIPMRWPHEGEGSISMGPTFDKRLKKRYIHPALPA